MKPIWCNSSEYFLLNIVKYLYVSYNSPLKHLNIHSIYKMATNQFYNYVNLFLEHFKHEIFYWQIFITRKNWIFHLKNRHIYAKNSPFPWHTLSLWRGCSARLRNRALALLHTFPRGSLSSALTARRPSRFKLHSGGFFRAFSSTSWSPDCRHCTSQTAAETRGGGINGSKCLCGEIRGRTEKWKERDKRHEVIMRGWEWFQSS